ncbi:unnamed protein product [Pleuronectes platessa]|uniref:Uncharacterized protein n=1 Tax=Pleuronectes platessa TaxID=8262 RepID=A0A9N7VNF3_PLEPL|nr:unnamed protein product [Pleuronectes platessa]
MEKVEPEKRGHHRTTLLNIISSLCSVASVAFCVLLSINAADIRHRVVDLESVNGGQTLIRAPGSSMDDLSSLVQQRVDELLSQRSYENLIKIRTARQTSPECNCPPAFLDVYASKGLAAKQELKVHCRRNDNIAGWQLLHKRPLSHCRICTVPSDTPLNFSVILPLKSTEVPFVMARVHLPSRAHVSPLVPEPQAFKERLMAEEETSSVALLEQLVYCSFLGKNKRAHPKTAGIRAILLKVEKVMEASRVCPAAGQMMYAPRLPGVSTKSSHPSTPIPSTTRQGTGGRLFFLETVCAKCDMKFESCLKIRVANKHGRANT